MNVIRRVDWQGGALVALLIDPNLKIDQNRLDGIVNEIMLYKLLSLNGLSTISKPGCMVSLE